MIPKTVKNAIMRAFVILTYSKKNNIIKIWIYQIKNVYLVK